MPIHCSLAAAVMVAAGCGFAASAHAAAVPMVVQGDTVLSGPCTLANTFKPDQRVVFRARVIDTATGDALDDKGLTSVVVELGDGTRLQAKYEGHPPGKVAGYYWVVAWAVPADHPTGTLGYKIVATNAKNETATFNPFEAPTSQLMIVK